MAWRWIPGEVGDGAWGWVHPTTGARVPTNLREANRSCSCFLPALPSGRRWLGVHGCLHPTTCNILPPHPTPCNLNPSP